MSTATVNKHLTAVAAILGKAGPPGTRNRDALGIISVAPWVRPLKEPRRAPRPIPLEVLGRIYAAAEIATRPSGIDVKPATWWRSFIAAAYSLGFRRGA